MLANVNQTEPLALPVSGAALEHTICLPVGLQYPGESLQQRRLQERIPGPAQDFRHCCTATAIGKGGIQVLPIMG